MKSKLSTQRTGQPHAAVEQAGPSTIAAGGSAARSFALKLPDGTAGVGTLQVTVTVDSKNNVVEYNAAGTAETNNTATTSVVSTLANYADLAVANVSSPGNDRSRHNK